MAYPISEEAKQNWKENILQQRSSKLSIAAWCRSKGLAIHAFYYWQKKLFPKACLNQPTFTEVTESKNSFNTGILLECCGVNIYLSNNFEPSVLKDCLEVIKRC